MGWTLAPEARGRGLAAEGGRAVGRIGTAVRHHELGTVALALLKRSAVAATGPEAAALWVALT